MAIVLAVGFDKPTKEASDRFNETMIHQITFVGGVH
jgi:hypothetical protein